MLRPHRLAIFLVVTLAACAASRSPRVTATNSLGAHTKDARVHGELLEDGSRRYVVRRGDTLGLLAKRFFGNEERWPEIFYANRHLLGTPTSISAGDVLTIPKPTTAED